MPFWHIGHGSLVLASVYPAGAFKVRADIYKVRGSLDDFSPSRYSSSILLFQPRRGRDGTNMDVQIVVSAERFEESQLAEIFGDFEGGHAVRRRISNQTALDESTINVLITGGFSTATAMITAMATVWVAKVKSVVNPPKTVRNSIHALTVVTNADDVAITVSSDGRDIVSGAELLPTLPDEVIELRFNSAQ